MSRKRPFCLTIAGFDPSGGAGILADIKTFEQNKVLGMAVTTANTIQTEDQFHSINWIDSNLIINQLDFLLTQYHFDFVKIGLIENLTLLKKIIDCLKAKNNEIKIIWDPILKATSGGDFDELRFKEIATILPELYAITPNLPEFETLFGNNDPQKIAIENKLFVYLKGGHAKTKKGQDILFAPSGQNHNLNPKSIGAFEKHGTGCILSAAWVAFLANGFPTLKAMVRAKDYVTKRINSNSTKLAHHK